MSESQISNVTTMSSDPTPKNPSFSIWPPSDRTREAVRARLIETLTSPSVLTKRYGTVSLDEATEASKLIEEEAFSVAGNEGSADDGIETLQLYSKHISKKMLHTVKSRNDNPVSVDDDAGSNAPAVSESIPDEE